MRLKFVLINNSNQVVAIGIETLNLRFFSMHLSEQNRLYFSRMYFIEID